MAVLQLVHCGGTSKVHCLVVDKFVDILRGLWQDTGSVPSLLVHARAAAGDEAAAGLRASEIGTLKGFVESFPKLLDGCVRGKVAASS